MAEDYKRGLSLAWHGAALNRAKRMPPLRRLLGPAAGPAGGPAGGPRQARPWQEVLAKVRAINALAGGKDRTASGANTEQQSKGSGQS